MRIGGGAVSIADVTDRTARDLGFVRPFWLNEIRAGRAFTRPAAVGASGGVNSKAQLFNPGGSGVNVLVHQINGSIGVAAPLFNLAEHNVALGTLLGTGFNLLVGGAAAQAVIRTEQSAGSPGSLRAQYRQLADVMTEFAKEWMFELGPGEGVAVYAGVNMEIEVNFWWVEVST